MLLQSLRERGSPLSGACSLCLMPAKVGQSWNLVESRFRIFSKHSHSHPASIAARGEKMRIHHLTNTIFVIDRLVKEDFLFELEAIAAVDG
jgi:hypothetical protein